MTCEERPRERAYWNALNSSCGVRKRQQPMQRAIELSKPTNAIELWISCSHCCHCLADVVAKSNAFYPTRLLIQNFQICALNREKEIECMIWRFVWLSCHINMVEFFSLDLIGSRFAFAKFLSINYLNWSLCVSCHWYWVWVWAKPQYLMCVEILCQTNGAKKPAKYTGSIWPKWEPSLQR